MSEAARMDPFWAVLSGLVFYFHQDPKEVRAALVAAAEHLWPLSQTASDTGAGDQVPRTSSLGKRPATFERLLREVDFLRTKKLSLSNATKSRAQTWSFFFMGSAPSADKAVNLPNVLYVEFPREVSSARVFDVVQSAFDAGPFFLGLGGDVIAVNDELYPRSGAEAVKALIRQHPSLRRADDTWLNPDYRRALSSESDLRIFDGPSEYVALAPDLADRLFPAGAWKGFPMRVTESAAANVFLHASLEAERRALAGVLRPFTVPLKKPRMFWKEPAWGEWRRGILFE